MPWNACLRLKLQIRQLWSSNDRTDHANVYGTPDNDTLSSFTRNSTREGLELQFALNQISRVGSPYCNAARFGAQLVQVRIMNLHHWAPNRTWGTNQTGKWVRRSPLGFLPHFDTGSGGDFSPVITITPLQAANQIPALVLILSAI